MRDIVDHVIAQLAAQEGFALVTLISGDGSTPRQTGAQMLVRADGSIAGTIGGGLLEGTMIAEARQAVATLHSRFAVMRLAGRSVQDAEMLCGGSTEVLIAFVPPRTLISPPFAQLSRRQPNMATAAGCSPSFLKQSRRWRLPTVFSCRVEN
jgi:xanthine dehydrogenase accessory factor